ncbi:MAG: beta-aspartyl-peptidase [Acidobacteriota bacterium]|nr:beta-aspartyl-peptidase [Acidobacteriota bacterium]
MIDLILNAEVYTPEPLGQMNLAVCAGRVIWMGTDPPPVSRELVTSEVDLEGARLIPGLIDGHVHVTGGGGEAGPESRVPPLGLSRFTRNGITSVVGLLGTDDLTRTTASLVTQVRGLVAEGLSAWCYTGGYHLPPATVTGSARGDIVLVDRVIGVGELALSDHRSSQPTLDELLKIAAEAHVAGLMTGKAGTVHLHMGDGERGLELVRRAIAGSEIPARVFHPTHVNRRKALFDEALRLAGEAGSTIDLTAFPVAEDEDAWSAEDALAKYLAAGLPAERVTVSSDGGGCLPVFDAGGRVTSMDVGEPGALIECLGKLLQAGHAMEAVLPAFTSNVADLLRLAGKGRVTVGGDADLVALEADGTARHVMARGRWHLLSGELTRHGVFEQSEIGEQGEARS